MSRSLPSLIAVLTVCGVVTLAASLPDTAHAQLLRGRGSNVQVSVGRGGSSTIARVQSRSGLFGRQNTNVTVVNGNSFGRSRGSAILVAKPRVAVVQPSFVNVRSHRHVPGVAAAVVVRPSFHGRSYAGNFGNFGGHGYTNQVSLANVGGYGHAGVRFNSFGTRTVVDAHGNVFEVDQFGNSVIRGNVNGSGYAFGNQGFGGYGFGGVSSSIYSQSTFGLSAGGFCH